MSEQVIPKVLEGEIRIPYKWTTGEITGRFLTGMRDSRTLLGARCNGCGKVWVPPGECCPVCLEDFEEKNFVPVSDEGTVSTFTVVRKPFMNQPAEPPYAIVAVRLRGADTDFLHIVRDAASMERLAVGSKVKAVWKESISGSLLDLDGFVVVAGEKERAPAGEIKPAGQPITKVRGEVAVPYKWSYGTLLSRFFHETSVNKKIMGARCTKCGKVLVPPVAICGRCFAETDSNWLQLSDSGVLITWTTVFLPFPGQPKEPPYTYGFIRLDGADTNFAHLIEECDPEKLKYMMRVKAVWNDQRKGDLFDIKYFRPE